VDDFGVVVDGVVVEGVVVVVGVVALVADAVGVGFVGVELWTAANAAPLPAVSASATVASRMERLGLRMSPPSRTVPGHIRMEAADAEVALCRR
jgi:hypothetical protein